MYKFVYSTNIQFSIIHEYVWYEYVCMYGMYGLRVVILSLSSLMTGYLAESSNVSSVYV